MAWIEKRKNGFLVCWRDDGKRRSRKFRQEADALEFKREVEPWPVDKLIAEAKKRGEFNVNRCQSEGRPLGG